MPHLKKRHLFLFITLFFAALLASCDVAGYLKGQGRIEKNQISVTELTLDQQNLVRLLSAGKTAHIFNYYIDESFSEKRLWVDIYEYGVLVETPNFLHTTAPGNIPLHGQIAIMISQSASTKEYQFTLIFSVSGKIVSAEGLITVIAGDENFASASGPMQGIIDIQDEKEIILHMTKFFRDNVFTDDLQVYAEQPELLAIYPRVHVVKVQFLR